VSSEGTESSFLQWFFWPITQFKPNSNHPIARIDACCWILPGNSSDVYCNTDPYKFSCGGIWNSKCRPITYVDDLL
jgi:hypothetical protein